MANPNPSPETRFKEGNVANPGGKTKKQKQAERKAAIKSAILRDKMLSAMMEKVEAGEDILDLMDANTLKLFKDSEDRAHGTPKSTSEFSGPNGGDIPTKMTVETKIVSPKD